VASQWTSFTLADRAAEVSPDAASANRRRDASRTVKSTMTAVARRAVCSRLGLEAEAVVVEEYGRK
jgi:hypothetical protein